MSDRKQPQGLKGEGEAGDVTGWDMLLLFACLWLVIGMGVGLSWWLYQVMK